MDSSSKIATDGVNNLSSEPINIESTSMVNIDNDNSVIESSTIIDQSTEPNNYLSSLSFVDLVETIFQKKEDNTKPTTLISEEIPLLSTNHEPETKTSEE